MITKITPNFLIPISVTRLIDMSTPLIYSTHFYDCLISSKESAVTSSTFDFHHARLLPIEYKYSSRNDSLSSDSSFNQNSPEYPQSISDISSDDDSSNKENISKIKKDDKTENVDLKEKTSANRSVKPPVRSNFKTFISER
ncbi:unnamed protein product [Arctia plantaginis]|uniref:Uncharacterized protein n=1 Tax=Arctia plantaginis TaxID=874455 RepID=A0A8S0ZFK5_ARCPL|nr:unnamed protein product [Arctia plantaginis]